MPDASAGKALKGENAVCEREQGERSRQLGALIRTMNLRLDRGAKMAASSMNVALLAALRSNRRSWTGRKPMAAEFRVFLSAVTSEFGTARDAVPNDLQARELQLRVQRSFRQEPGADTLLRLLHDYIRDCNAVCVIGARSGPCPSPAEFRPRSTSRDRWSDGRERRPKPSVAWRIGRILRRICRIRRVLRPAAQLVVLLSVQVIGVARWARRVSLGRGVSRRRRVVRR